MEYKELSRNEFDSETRGSIYGEKYSNSELQKIGKFIDTIGNFAAIDHFGYSYMNIKIYEPDIHAILIKYPDEWFYLALKEWRKQEAYYKCDQLEGLISCIKTFLNNE